MAMYYEKKLKKIEKENKKLTKRLVSVRNNGTTNGKIKQLKQ